MRRTSLYASAQAAPAPQIASTAHSPQLHTRTSAFGIEVLLWQRVAMHAAIPHAWTAGPLLKRALQVAPTWAKRH